MLFTTWNTDIKMAETSNELGNLSLISATLKQVKYGKNTKYNIIKNIINNLKKLWSAKIQQQNQKTQRKKKGKATNKLGRFEAKPKGNLEGNYKKAFVLEHTCMMSYLARVCFEVTLLLGTLLYLSKLWNTVGEEK